MDTIHDLADNHKLGPPPIRVATFESTPKKIIKLMTKLDIQDSTTVKEAIRCLSAGNLKGAPNSSLDQNPKLTRHSTKGKMNSPFQKNEKTDPSQVKFISHKLDLRKISKRYKCINSRSNDKSSGWGFFSYLFYFILLILNGLIVCGFVITTIFIFLILDYLRNLESIQLEDLPK